MVARKAPTSTPVRTKIFALSKQSSVLFDIRSRTALLLHQEGGDPVPLLPLSPSASRVFLALLQAYPQYCSHQTLLAALYPAVQETPDLGWEQHVRPIRRALHRLAPVLQAFGLEVVALRRRGYLLAPSPNGRT